MCWPARRQRYLREAVAGLRSDAFWCLLYIGSTSRKAVSHAHNWFQKEQGNPIQMLDWVTYKCLSLARSFDDLLNDESHWGELLEIIEPLPPAMQSFWMSEAVLAVLEMHCDFVRRFLVDASHFPHAIL